MARPPNILAAAMRAILKRLQRKFKSKRPMKKRKACASSHALGGLALLRKAGARGLLHRPWGVLKGAHGSWLKLGSALDTLLQKKADGHDFMLQAAFCTVESNARHS